MNAIGYIRVSTEQQADKFGPSAQKEAIASYAASHGYTITEWIEDHISGVKDDRPGFNRILAMKNNPRTVDAVIAFKVDRIARDVMLYCYYQYSLEKKGIDLISAMEDFTATYGDFAPVMLSVSAYIGKKERENITLRTTQGKIEKAAKGGYIGGKIPYGYSVTDHSLVIDPNEAAIVQTIFKMADSGERQADIVRSLNNAGFTTRSGGPFLAQHVRSIRKNRPFYEGLYKARSGEWVKGQHEPLLESDPLS